MDSFMVILPIILLITIPIFSVLLHWIDNYRVKCKIDEVVKEREEQEELEKHKNEYMEAEVISEEEIKK